MAERGSKSDASWAPSPIGVPLWAEPVKRGPEGVRKGVGVAWGLILPRDFGEVGEEGFAEGAKLGSFDNGLGDGFGDGVGAARVAALGAACGPGFEARPEDAFGGALGYAWTGGCGGFLDMAGSRRPGGTYNGCNGSRVNAIKTMEYDKQEGVRG
jgi:hypothetical protein